MQKNTPLPKQKSSEVAAKSVGMSRPTLELMLKIMANENMDDYSTNTAIIDNTVQSGLDFLEKSRENDGHIGVDEIAHRGRFEKSPATPLRLWGWLQ